MSSPQAAAPRRATTELVIGFFDLGRFTANAQRLDDDELASALDEFYCLVHEGVTASGGEVLKTLGDGALACWPADRADDALASSFRLRDATRQWAGVHGLDTPLVTRLHFGTASLGAYGPQNDPRRDAIGKDVFVAARLEARSISVSAELFRKLSPESRKALKKHTPPVVYIPVGDPRP